jgi:hypothetical protein
LVAIVAPRVLQVVVHEELCRRLSTAMAGISQRPRGNEQNRCRRRGGQPGEEQNISSGPKAT